jgi:isopenicillin N synthase-like dioxygenase
LAVVLVGSVLGHVTGDYYPACRHLVTAAKTPEHRMAATLFLRPNASAKLVVPPSIKLQNVKLKRNDVTFEEWNKRVSKRYMKGNGKAK